MARTGLSQAALARATGVDRSTVSALLAGGTRLPNAQLAADCAAALGVSCDWLLGLSARPEPADDLLAAATLVTEAARALIDETIFAWHREAAGYKIRHVPALLPDMLKTREMVEWEYAGHLGRSPEQALRSFEERLAWMRGSGSDYEIAVALHEVQALAEGSGYYSALAPAIRTAQIARMADLCDTLYPRLRLCLYDARMLFSAPVTIFGPKLAALYLGRNFLVFRDPARIEIFAAHVDGLVRGASIGAREAAGYLRRLLQTGGSAATAGADRELPPPRDAPP
ncbi:MAG: helix-turn-helix transcriptional regulator [Rhodobacteraceae bacterium]|jgi:transcriptional regulator with XRE-family HTH domain|nr:helix-turn-helix transcriptional regulator [Paracoccaceae bacterium]